MPYYEIVNPSDACTIEAPDDNTAAIAVILLGEGKYGCEKENGESINTLLMFSSKEQIEQRFDELGLPPGNNRIDTYLREDGGKLIDVFESIMYCKLGVRKALMVAFEGLPDKITRLAKFNDERRTSMSDIGKWAHGYADGIRKMQKTKPKKVPSEQE